MINYWLRCVWKMKLNFEKIRFNYKLEKWLLFDFCQKNSILVPAIHLPEQQITHKIKASESRRFDWNQFPFYWTLIFQCMKTISILWCPRSHKILLWKSLQKRICFNHWSWISLTLTSIKKVVTSFPQPKAQRGNQ